MKPILANKTVAKIPVVALNREGAAREVVAAQPKNTSTPTTICQKDTKVSVRKINFDVKSYRTKVSPRKENSGGKAASGPDKFEKSPRAYNC